MARYFGSFSQACFTPHLGCNGATEDVNLAAYSRILFKCVIISYLWLITDVLNGFPPKPRAKLLVAWCIFYLILSLHTLLLGWGFDVLIGIFSTFYIPWRCGFLLTISSVSFCLPFLEDIYLTCLNFLTARNAVLFCYHPIQSDGTQWIVLCLP